jgi:hypothetical protein
VPGCSADRIRVASDVPEWESVVQGETLICAFRPPAGWRTRVERYAAS